MKKCQRFYVFYGTISSMGLVFLIILFLVVCFVAAIVGFINGWGKSVKMVQGKRRGALEIMLGR
jgi:hypothetical protein